MPLLPITSHELSSKSYAIQDSDSGATFKVILVSNPDHTTTVVVEPISYLEPSGLGDGSMVTPPPRVSTYQQEPQVVNDWTLLALVAVRAYLRLRYQLTGQGLGAEDLGILLQKVPPPVQPQCRRVSRYSREPVI